MEKNAMGDQEQDFFQEQDRELEAGATDRLSMLHLSPSATLDRHRTTAIPPITTSVSADLLEKCANCGGSAKRQPPSSFKEPSPKRPTLHSASAATTNHRFPGFTKLPLPNPLHSPLRRTVSEPVYFSGNTATAPSHFSSGQGPILNPPLEEGSASKSNEPPLVEAPPPGLYRTISDPTPVTDHQLEATTTPPRPPARKFSRSPRKTESPSAKRLNKMKERLKEMNQWWKQVLQEGEEGEHEDSGAEDHNADNKNAKDETENEEEEDADEAVWVERKGEYLVLHFRCPCGQGYQILLCENICYYKLTSF